MKEALSLLHVEAVSNTRVVQNWYVFAVCQTLMVVPSFHIPHQHVNKINILNLSIQDHWFLIEEYKTEPIEKINNFDPCKTNYASSYNEQQINKTFTLSDHLNIVMDRSEPGAQQG